MKAILLFFILLFNIALAESLDDLLQEYQEVNEKSLHTLDEKMGHVVVYSQQDIRRMQYNTLDDILKELPRKNLNKNRYGVNTSTLSGTGTSVSGFFRFFINDHEISSVHTQSSSLTWGNIPLDFVDYVEVYYGESSFSLGNETGIYFIRIYTKQANKTNGGAVVYRTDNHGSNTQNILHSQTLDNGWSYLFFASRNSENDKAKISTKSINNDSKRQHVFLDLSNEATSINVGYSEVKKESYFGLSKDLQSNDGEIQSKDLYVNLSQYFLDDHSLKLNASYDINTRFYEESNDEGLSIVPIANPYNTNSNISFYTEDLELEKTKLYVSKTASWGNHNILTGFDYSKKTYKVKNREYTETIFGPPSTTHYSIGHFYDYDEEHTYSLLFQDEYKAFEKLSLIGNAKIDKYERKGIIKDSTENLYRVGFIYTPTNHLGFKGFYNKTYVPPTFYNVDFDEQNGKEIESQKYRFYTFEAVYTTNRSKSSLQYNNVRIRDFIYLTPVGFRNIDYQIKTKGFIFDYEYLFANDDKFHFNYFATTINQTASNSESGGYIKYMGTYNSFEYFSSLIYRNSYYYGNSKVSSSVDMSLGVTYYITPDLSVSLKGENLFDKSTQSVYSDNGTNVTFRDRDRNFGLTMKWVF